VKPEILKLFTFAKTSKMFSNIAHLGVGTGQISISQPLTLKL